MHVHGNHLNVSMPMDTGAANKAAASQRAAEMRRKLMKAGAGAVDTPDFEDTIEDLLVEEQAEEGRPREQQKADGESSQAAKLNGTDGGEGEGSLEQRASYWA